MECRFAGCNLRASNRVLIIALQEAALRPNMANRAQGALLQHVDALVSRRLLHPSGLFIASKPVRAAPQSIEAMTFGLCGGSDSCVSVVVI